MMHEITLQTFKKCKSHGLLNSKHMDCNSNLPFPFGLCYNPLINGVCVRNLELVRYHIKEA